MPSFVVISLRDQKKLEAKIKEQIPETDLYSLTGDAWLVSFSGTTKQLSDALDISDGETGPAVVLAVGNYFGRANPDIWEWLKLHFSLTS